jgi:hypothetical protein
MLQGHVSSKDAHEMMMLMVMPCHDHAQLMLICKANTWGVTDITNKIPSDEKMEFIKGSHVGSTNMTQQVTSISTGFQPYITGCPDSI